MIVCAGVSALRPLLEVAGLERHDGAFSPPQVTTEGVKHAVGVAEAAMQGNFFGPLVSAITFVRALLRPPHPTPSLLPLSLSPQLPSLLPPRAHV